MLHIIKRYRIYPKVKKHVLEFSQKSDCSILMNMEINRELINLAIAYGPQAAYDNEEKDEFWEGQTALQNIDMFRPHRCFKRNTAWSCIISIHCLMIKDLLCQKTTTNKQKTTKHHSFFLPFKSCFPSWFRFFCPDENDFRARTPHQQAPCQLDFLPSVTPKKF